MKQDSLKGGVLGYTEDVIAPNGRFLRKGEWNEYSKQAMSKMILDLRMENDKLQKQLDDKAVGYEG